MAVKVFISYRREDSAGYAGRILDRLGHELERDHLFIDVDGIPLGLNFVKLLREEVAKCDVLLAVIGRDWLDARDEDGTRRLNNPNDFVRIEVATALQRDIPVIPILLDGTRVPKADELPEDLRELPLRNGLGVHHASFHADMTKLIRELKEYATEAGRKAEEERQAAEARRKAEEEWQAAEVQRKAEEKRQAAEARRKAEDERQAAEARRKAEDERQAAEARRKAEDERQAAQAERAAEACPQATESQAAALQGGLRLTPAQLPDNTGSWQQTSKVSQEVDRVPQNLLPHVAARKSQHEAVAKGAKVLILSFVGAILVIAALGVAIFLSPTNQIIKDTKSPKPQDYSGDQAQSPSSRNWPSATVNKTDEDFIHCYFSTKEEYTKTRACIDKGGQLAPANQNIRAMESPKIQVEKNNQTTDDYVYCSFSTKTEYSKRSVCLNNGGRPSPSF